MIVEETWAGITLKIEMSESMFEKTKTKHWIKVAYRCFLNSLFYDAIMQPWLQDEIHCFDRYESQPQKTSLEQLMKDKNILTL